MTAAKSRPLLWIADANRIAHAREHRQSTRTACGIVAIPERYSWPVTAKCVVCLRALEASA